MEKSKTYKNTMGEYVCLTQEVFELKFGNDYNNPRVAKDLTRMDFSGPEFALETLTGPDQGIMSSKCNLARNYVQILNIGRNALTDISCIDKRSRTGEPEFCKLSCLIASRNQLTNVYLTLPNLLELNLAHNELTAIPNCSKLEGLQTLILAHNRISDTLKNIEKNNRLRKLQLHDNQLSWKPSEFEKQMEILSRNHVASLTLFPNPFAEVFWEYQFLAVTRIDTLVELDLHPINDELSSELKAMEEKMRAANGLDMSIFDIKVQDRKTQNDIKGRSAEDFVDLAKIPTLPVLIKALTKPLDHSNQLIKYIYAFKEQVSNLWGARYSDRVKTLEARDPTGATLEINEFSDKMQILLSRFDSAQDVLVECLIRLTASGNLQLSQQCAILLADWVDALPPDLQEKLQSEISISLFRDLRVRLVEGMQSFADDPGESLEVEKGRLNQKLQDRVDQGFFGDNEGIAECAEILGALARFGRSSFAKQSSMSRSIILAPLIPVLCRAPRSVLTQIDDLQEKYPGFGFFAGAALQPPLSDEPIYAPQEGFEETCKTRCVKRGYGGFALKPSTKRPGLMEARFAREHPDALRGMRTLEPGSTLYCMPSSKASRPRDMIETGGIKETLTWDVWKNGLDVLVVATADPKNASMCIRKYELHKILLKHEKDVFTEGLLNITVEAGIAFTALMNLTVNLLNAKKGAAEIARRAFKEGRLHVSCWDRVRRRLTEGGGSVARTRLKQAKPEFAFLISALVRVVYEMTRHDSSHLIMQDLMDGMDDLFKMMLEIAGDTDVPDPLLLSASLQTIYMLLEAPQTRVRDMGGGQTLVSMVLNKCHDMANLLPYIQGPKVRDANNNKYQDLWMICETKYNMDKHGKDRLPQLYDPEARQSGEWRDKCPELRSLQNPMMHRVLLDIVKLIELFSREAGDKDKSGAFSAVALMLDNNDREKILIGPSTGLVLVPDYDVKISVLEVIQHVLENSPDQFQTQEMGWLLRYLQSTGIGIGRQEDFLMEVLSLVRLLIENDRETGYVFRLNFAKQAIRQAYEMLKANTARDVQGAKDEEKSKVDLSLRIVLMLRSCSKPLSGGLRKFLRRTDFMTIIQGVMIAEDGPHQTGIREPLLRTWTGRDLREVLLPLVTMNYLDVVGFGRYRALVRMADVLQGKNDFQTSDQRASGYAGVLSSNEQLMWMGRWMMKHTLQIDDDYFHADSRTQQQEFMAQGGIDGVLQYAERVLGSSEDYVSIRTTADLQVRSIVTKADEQVSQWWHSVADQSKKKDATEKEEKKSDEKKKSNLETFLAVRLEATNEHLGLMFKGISIKRRVEKTGDNTLQLIASHLKAYVEECHKKYLSYVDDDHYQRLKELPNLFQDKDGKLLPVEEIKKDPKFQKCRQLVSSLDEHERLGKTAHVALKRMLVSKQEASAATLAWAETAQDSDQVNEDRKAWVKQGLVDFVEMGTCYDPGLRPITEIERFLAFKYMDDVKRVRNRARLILEFKTPGDLIQCYELLKKNTRFSIAAIRNRFAKPTALGERYIKVYAEVVASGTKYICEINLVICREEPGESYKREIGLKDKLRTVLREYCQVGPEQIDAITEFVHYEAGSRAVRHQDMVYIQSEDEDKKHITVNDEKVFISSGKMDQRNIFNIVRVDEYGPVRTGDIVQFRNMLTGCYLDASNVNYGIRCRYKDADTEKSCLKFVIEAAPDVSDSGVPAGLTMFTQADGAVATEKEPKEGERSSKRVSKKVVHNWVSIINHGTRFMLKVHGVSSPQRRVTVQPPSRWGVDEQVMKAKAKIVPDCDAAPQIFVMYREGSLKDFLHARDMKEAERITEGKLFSIVQTKDKDQLDLLKGAYMAPTLKTSAPQEGGIYRRAPPSFQDIALREETVTVVKEEEDEDEEPDESSGLGTHAIPQSMLLPVTVAALCRCIYVLLELPFLHEARVYAIDDFLGDLDDSVANLKFCRLLKLVVAASTEIKTGVVTKESILYAWVSAKTLRTFSSALTRMPALSLPAAPRKLRAHLPDYGMGEYTRMEETGVYDRQRLLVLKIFSRYISDVLAAPVLRRLAIATQRPLQKTEITLLVEICKAVSSVALALYSNELRSYDSTVEKVDKAAIQEDPTKAITDGAAEKEADDGEGGFLDFFVEEEEEIKSICGDLHAEVFSNLIPPIVIHVLVHAFLNGMRLEAQAYAAQRNIASETETCVKLVSSLVHRSIQALAVCMAGCEATEETSCDYNVCEAVSHAMSAGGQFVPKARVTQLMSEWHLERHRKNVQQKLRDGAKEESLGSTIDGNTIYLKPEDTEKVHIIAIVWHCTFRPGCPPNFPTDVAKRLLVVTSRQNIAILTLPEGTGVEIPDPDDMDVVLFNNLSRVQRLVTHPRMRQFIGLLWDEGMPEAFIQAIFFENHHRQRDFLECIRLVTRFKYRPHGGVLIDPSELDKEGKHQKLEVGPGKEIHETPVKRDMLLKLRKSCKPRENPRAEAQLVNVSFIKSQNWQTPGGNPGIDVLIMTQDALIVISIRSFLLYFSTAEENKEYKPSIMDDREDSDSDKDGIPPVMEGDPTEMDAEEIVLDEPAFVIGPAFLMNQLSGVWFMANPEPTVNLQFNSNALQLNFFCDGDRQRFRQHLACVLKQADEGDGGADQQGSQGKMWRVKPTNKDDLATVKKEVKEVEQEVTRHQEHVAKINQLALGNA